MGTFNLIEEHQKIDEQDGYVSTNPHWILLVVRYSEPLTSSKQRIIMKSEVYSGNISYSDDPSLINKERQKLLITSDCVSMNVSSNKNNYIQSLNAILKNGNINYLSSIMPGDWVMAWIMNSKSTYDSVLEKIKKNKPANDFYDGFKFIGRVQNIRKILMQDGSGLKTMQYSLDATAFSEFDSVQYFDPNLSRAEEYIDEFLRNLNIPLAEIMETSAANSKQIGGISINKVIPAFIKAFLGEGIRGLATEGGGGLELAVGGSINTQEAPFAYVIPESIAPLLNISIPSKDSRVYSYADMLEVVQGLQKYESHDFPNMFFPLGTPNEPTPLEKDAPPLEYKCLIDNKKEGEKELVNRHFTKYPLKGVFLPMPTSFNMRSIWALIQQYLNPVVNEMYTAIKYCPSGRVMPSLTVRQLPFSSLKMEEKMKQDVTSFYELPRWRPSSVLVRGMDIGRNDALRTNFIHIYAQSTKPILNSRISEQITKWPPVADAQDIKRSGLRIHMGEVTTSFLEQEPNEWMKFRADFLMGQHLMLNGVCSLVGVTLPISIGDNFEFDDTIYHIEAVNHSCSISPDGRKTFTTQLQLSHGVSSQPEVGLRGGVRTTVDANPRVRKEKQDMLLKIITDEYNKNPQNEKDELNTINEFEKQITKLEIETLSGDITNPDITLYSSVYEEDNTAYDPGTTKSDEDEEI